MAIILTQESLSDVEFDSRMLSLIESGRTIKYGCNCWFWYEKDYDQIPTTLSDKGEGMSRPFESFFQCMNNAIGLPTVPLTHHHASDDYRLPRALSPSPDGKQEPDPLHD